MTHAVDEKKKSVYACEDVKFEDLKLPAQVYQNVLCELKFTLPSEIQAKSIPIMLSDKRPNFIGQAKSGSGKTVAYALAILCRIDPTLKHAQAICVTPTRELAIQVCDVFNLLVKNTGMTVKKAIVDEPKGVVSDQIVVGTPGTLVAKLKFNDIDASKIVCFVVDEADEMLKAKGPGLGEQTLQIKTRCKNKLLQSFLFSATFPTDVSNFAKAIAPKAETVLIKPDEVALDNVRQFWVDSNEDKYKCLTLIFALLSLGQSIIFVDSVKLAKDLCNRLRGDGFSVSLLHGQDMKPAERDAVMRDFRTGKTTVLIATNVLARGIDVPSVNLVINYNVPAYKGKPEFETYSHRVGRSGRFGRPGAAVSFVAPNEKPLVEIIAKHFGKPITKLPLPHDIEQTEQIIKSALK